MALRIVEQTGRSDVGRQRSANEDNLVLSPPFFAVADGMGGAKAGEVASKIAAEAFGGAAASGQGPPEGELERIARDANRQIHDLANADESRRGMGTTLTAAKVIEGKVSLGHVGDSRAYVFRDGRLEQLTKDHSLVAELERSGQITREAAEHHPQRSIITRALGPEPDVAVDTCTVPGRDGDVFLLCSDGLTGMLDDDDVAGILRSATALDEAAEALIEAANQSGGKDNITVVLFRLGEEAEAAGAPATEEHPAEETIAGQVSSADLRRASAPRAPAAQRLRGAPPDATIVRPSGVRPMDVPAAPRRGRARARRRLRRLVSLLVTLVLLLAVVGGLYALSRQVWFVGTNDAGLVTLYRGVPYELPFGIELYEEEYASGVPAGAIPRARRAHVLNHDWRSRQDAEDLVRQLEQGRVAGAGGGT